MKGADRSGTTGKQRGRAHTHTHERTKTNVRARDRQELIRDNRGADVPLPLPQGPRSLNLRDPYLIHAVRRVRRVGAVVGLLVHDGVRLSGDRSVHVRHAIV